MSIFKRFKKKFSKDKSPPENIGDLKEEVQIRDHLLSIDELQNKYGVNVSMGLSDIEAASRLTRDGPNVLTESKSVPEWKKFVKQLAGGFSLLLWCGSICCFIAYGLQTSQYGVGDIQNVYLGVVLAVVVVITAIFSYYQESKSSKIMESFKNMSPPKINVLRNSQIKTIASSELVIGDVVLLKLGDRVPADCVIVECSSLKVDNSSLTGESEAVSRSVTNISNNPLETQNLIFFGTSIIEGTGTGLIVQCGNNTVIGRIAKLTSELTIQQTPIAKEIAYFIRLISVVAIFLGVVFFIVALSLKYSWIDSVVFLIGIVVANVPEGLLATVTVSLTLTAKRMAKSNCIVKNLESVETLGSTSTICSDKTGTLTQNKMTVSHLFIGRNMYDANVSNEKTSEDLHEYENDKAYQDFITICSLCSRASFVEDEDNNKLPVYLRQCRGDASEVAILKFCEIVKGQVEEYRKRNSKLFEVPFNSTNKFQLSIHKIPEDPDNCLLVIKGAPEKIITYCKTVRVEDKEIPIDQEYKDYFGNIYYKIGGYGERLLGLASKKIDRSFIQDQEIMAEIYNEFLKDLVFSGLISMHDPPRPNVPMSVEKCRSAGIRVIMVTGDHPQTAKAIARAVGIISPKSMTIEDILEEENDLPIEEIDLSNVSAVVIHGQDLQQISDDDLDEMLKHYQEVVFARTSPQQKLRIVEGCQRIGAIVAVTGDGVNDSPALKQADIGVAMGITGSDVSKQAADMILMDDNFASIVAGVQEGRLIFDNLKKSIAYTLTSNIPEITPFLLFIIFGIPLPLDTITILLIDLGTDMFPAISLAYEKSESDIMKRKPRNAKTDKLVNHKLTYGVIGMIQASAGFLCYYIVFAQNGFLPSRIFRSIVPWESIYVNDWQDSYGQEWTRESRMILEQTAQSMFFAAIVMVQWTDLLICKTRLVSFFRHGMGNQHMNFALVFETVLALALIYTPGLNNILNLQNLFYLWFLIPLPYTLLIFIFDEIRKLIIRRRPEGWLKEETYY